MQIFIKTLSGKTRTLVMEPSDTVLAIRKKLNEFDNRIIYASKDLVDNKTLDEYKLENGSTLQVLGRIYGGMWRQAALKATREAADKMAEKKRKEAEEEKKRKEAEDMRKRKERAKKAEEERKRKEAEEKRKEDAKKLAEEKRKEQERKKAEEERKKRDVKERKRKEAEERKKREAEERKKKEQARREAEERKKREANEPGVVLYVDTRFKGRWAKYKAGEYPAIHKVTPLRSSHKRYGKYMNMWANDVSSMRVYPGFKVTFYRYSNFRGNRNTWYSYKSGGANNVSRLGWWNDKMVSMKVERIGDRCAHSYPHTPKKGDPKYVCKIDYPVCKDYIANKRWGHCAKWVPPKRCKTCKSGDSKKIYKDGILTQSSGGVKLENGVCKAWCSSDGHCGVGKNFKENGTRCAPPGYDPVNIVDSKSEQLREGNLIQKIVNDNSNTSNMLLDKPNEKTLGDSEKAFTYKVVKGSFDDMNPSEIKKTLGGMKSKIAKKLDTDPDTIELEVINNKNKTIGYVGTETFIGRNLFEHLDSVRVTVRGTEKTTSEIAEEYKKSNEVLENSYKEKLDQAEKDGARAIEDKNKISAEYSELSTRLNQYRESQGNLNKINKAEGEKLQTQMDNVIGEIQNKINTYNDEKKEIRKAYVGNLLSLNSKADSSIQNINNKIGVIKHYREYMYYLTILLKITILTIILFLIYFGINKITDNKHKYVVIGLISFIFIIFAILNLKNV